ncbi:MAG: hypothetical protein ABI167_04130 [Nitrosospira sp.]
MVVVSSSDSIKDRAEAASMGADAYFRKPSGYEAYIRIGEIVKDLLLIKQPPGSGRLMPSRYERPFVVATQRIVLPLAPILDLFRNC